ncbi:adenosylmethionine--8-amino-7-oxononanoate transaminase [Allofrancisella guangzhouensis]|uniref:Adenosylmethionine-8-amino-7-oxononanoate aminotransferase n=2 Tax=Pseudomonadota TaxID=1224 RepID=A0A0A8E9Y9_9GAMM|nr:adenosylmethionine--8-amino-7-oxononanoate transaminase [Allofrancisella guangzhouensis]AJC48976.1 adenosylmethionine-8-amino-7-oxononanoate aminotransferase [Allofrancisella guangzhouensis]MBK2027881.1 adenosylmethionine--8-amino-7-oxononanoate transaminase [Allofrancisella guangzhouensis]MBK2044134.1 adenosylmethionine--8-amino-7-oxononanoate transaminase [Allofrancisella guangzhouensis]MBK2045114.1 adenosylmethionine--8-amino-7-oxononanoate transaminase [Allofrancisella guangzhouensis]
MAYSTNIWHPCTQMKDFERNPPLEVIKTQGRYIYTKDNRKLFDATSSWWCKSLGHKHPSIISKLKDQLDKYEHTIFANTTNDEINTFSQKICKLTNMDKTLYASDGSCAVEIALKMTTHIRKFNNQSNKFKFLCLENSYHGETLATMSVSDCSLYSEPYKALLFESFILKGIPYVTGKNDPLWNNAEAHWLESKKYLEQHKDNINALIVEPICQGAGGMLIYSKDYLNKLCKWCKENDIFIIFDEIMTGIGRLGKMFAFEYLDIQPDFLCLSKGITSGNFPFSVVLTKNEYYQMFYGDDLTKAFLHSHTHSGNVLGAVCANAVLEIFEQEKVLENVLKLEELFLESFLEIQKEIPILKNIRNIGAVIAADLDVSKPRFGLNVYREAIKIGALLRPLGNTIYWLPPLNSTKEEIQQLKVITKDAILKSLKT